MDKLSLKKPAGHETAQNSSRRTSVKPQTAYIADNRPSAALQRKQAQHMNHGLLAQQERSLQSRIQQSTYLTTQRKALNVAFAETAQRQLVDDKSTQGGFETAQRIELEGGRGLQARSEPVQKKAGLEDDELLQRKLDSVQRKELEDEELLQGRFEPVQREQGLEEEELLQGRFDTVQRMEDNGLLRARPEPIKQKDNKTGLPDRLKSGIESLSGMDMSDVRVHYNSSRPAQLNALAFAQGNEIHLGAGQEQHLPHEAWHVVQQREGKVKPTRQMAGEQINDDVGLEKEADVMGEKALSRTSASV